MDGIKAGADVFFVAMGAILVLAMHMGFALLEVATPGRTNQINALDGEIKAEGYSFAARLHFPGGGPIF